MKILIAGIGKLGFRLAKDLVEEGVEVTVIDKNEQLISNVTNVLDVMSVQGNALDLMLLKEMDVNQYDAIIATTKSDEVNVILCTMSKKMGCKKVIGRVRDPEYHKHLPFISKELNIDYIINPDYETALAIEKYLSKKYLLMSDDLIGGKVKLVEFNIEEDEQFVNKKLMDLSGFGDLLVTTIYRDGKTIIPSGQTILKKNDSILIAGKSDEIEEFDREHSGIIREKNIRKAMIVGGGKIGFYLATMLAAEEIETTIIEIDYERCVFLKEKLPNCNIINGDGTDLDLLEEEMVNTFDAFIATTGIDEANLLISLVVNQDGMYKSVAKISRNNYSSIIDKLLIDAVFNTNIITANRILGVIRGAGSLYVNLMLDGNMEFLEVKINKEIPAVNKKIKDLNLPKGILIVAIVRKNQVIIPNGETILEEDDSAILFWNHENAEAMHKTFHKKIKKKSIFNYKKSKRK